MAIIHMGGGTVEPLDNYKPTLDPFGFDDLAYRILYRGTIDALMADYSLGTVLSGSQMYCVGVQNVEKNRFGHIWATIGFKGFWNLTGNKPQIKSYSWTTRETELPRSYTGAGGSVVTYVKPPMVPSLTNPNTKAYWRVRLIDRIAGATINGVSIGTPSSPPTPPRMEGEKPAGPPGSTFLDWRNLWDPTYNFPNGWQLRDFQTNSQFAAGSVALYFWTGRYEYIDAYGP